MLVLLVVMNEYNMEINGGRRYALDNFALPVFAEKVHRLSVDSSTAYFIRLSCFECTVCVFRETMILTWLSGAGPIM
jgi:hypothetical protein